MVAETTPAAEKDGIKVGDRVAYSVFGSYAEVRKRTRGRGGRGVLVYCPVFAFSKNSRSSHVCLLPSKSLNPPVHRCPLR